MANEDTIDVQAKYLTTQVNIAKNVATQTTLVDLGERMLESFDAFFAPGHVGLTGFRILYGGVAIVPWNQSTSFIVGNNERRPFTLGLHVSGKLSIVTTNLDKAYAHAIVFTFKLTELLLVGESGESSTPLTIAAVG